MRAVAFYLDSTDRAIAFLRKVSKMFLRKVSKMKASRCYFFVKTAGTKRGDKKKKETNFKLELDRDNRDFYLHLPEGSRTISPTISAGLIEHFCTIREEERDSASPWELEYAMSRYFEHHYIKFVESYGDMLASDAAQALALIREYIDDILAKIAAMEAAYDEQLEIEQAQQKRDLQHERDLLKKSMMSSRGTLRQSACKTEFAEDDEDVPTSSFCETTAPRLKRVKPSTAPVHQPPQMEQKLDTLVDLLTRKLEKDLSKEAK